jgi:HK97 family phage portal protein
MNIATVYRCVNLLADSVANLPIQYMRLKGDIFVEDRTSRLHYLLNVQPCSYMSAVDYWRQVVQYLLLNGNAYIVPIYDYLTMEVASLYLVDPTCVSHDTINDKYTVLDRNAGISGVYDEDEIIHIKNYTRDGKHGLSTLAFARTTMDIALTGDAETLNRFANGGNVRGIVSNDTSVRGFGEYQDKELEKAATDLDGRFRAGERIVSLPGQVQFNPISLSSTDMQFLESRKFTVRDICRFFGVHPSFVFDDTSNNYKSAEMANVAFLSNTLNPILRKIEVELHRKLVAPSLCCKRKFQFDRRGLYACDLDSRIKYQAQTIAAGIYTVNDWRKEENKPAVDGGDTVLVSANLKSINEAGKPTTAPVPVEPISETEPNEEDGKE